MNVIGFLELVTLDSLAVLSVTVRAAERHGECVWMNKQGVIIERCKESFLTLKKIFFKDDIRIGNECSDLEPPPFIPLSEVTPAAASNVPKVELFSHWKFI